MIKLKPFYNKQTRKEIAVYFDSITISIIKDTNINKTDSFNTFLWRIHGAQFRRYFLH